MPRITIYKDGTPYSAEVADNTNLVVRAGIKQFPYPHLKYKCGMGKCGTCASRILAGAEHLPPPNWKEQKVLRDQLAQGYRLCCQIWIHHDLELVQDIRITPSEPDAGTRSAQPPCSPS